MSNNINFLQLNKFAELHNGNDIFFCKTDFLNEDFNTIKKLTNNVILITGNSDYPITDDYLRVMPKNIIKWYGQNILSNNDIFEPLPIGLENRFECVRVGHGIGYYERVTEKESLLSNNSDSFPNKKIYFNCNLNTNFRDRHQVYSLCKNLDYIDVDEPILSLKEFFNKILNYKMVVCPAGNGVDTHRLWEVLYSRRIPITIKIGNYKIYKLYEKFPIIVLNSIDDLKNPSLIEEKYDEIKQKFFNNSMLEYDFWRNKILENYKNK